MTRLFLLLSLTFFGYTTAATAQSQSTYSSAQPNGCLVWNPAPQPNEHVHWTGACKDGYGEGKGTIFWSVDRGGKVELSSTQTNLVRGKLEGPSKDIFASGSINYRVFRNGAVSYSITKSDFEKQYHNDDDYFDGVNLSELERRFEKAGYSVVSRSADNDPKPYITFKGSSDRVYRATGTACSGVPTMCRGISLGYTAAHLKNFEAAKDIANDYNLTYSFTRAYITTNYKDRYTISHYIILDHGIAQENLRIILVNFEAMAENANALFK